VIIMQAASASAASRWRADPAWEETHPAEQRSSAVDDSAVRVDDPRVSRRHAEFRRAVEGTWTLTDLGSANGTFVNGAPLKGTIALKPGDRVRVAETVFRVL
jgi:pSer/pThr/pTyr-binding forkhead associated (FHA) protein